MERILVAMDVWKDFEPSSEQLNANVLKVEQNGDIISKEVYFTGCSFGEQKCRVYGEVCCKGTAKGKRALLLVGELEKPVCHDDLVMFAEKGFVAMSIDYAGGKENSLHTLYPEEISYCNAEKNISYFEIGLTVKQSKLYYYALNSMRAITYLQDEENASEFSVLSIKNGYLVGAIVTGIDTRVSNVAIVNSNLSVEHPDTNFAGDDINEVLARKETAQAWNTGLSPQNYCFLTRAPLYAVVGANCDRVDIAEFCWYFDRFSAKSRIAIVPETIDVIDEHVVDSIAKWLQGEFADEQKLEVEQTCSNGRVEVAVKTNHQENLSVWFCRSYNKKCRNWVKGDTVEIKNGYKSTIDMFANSDIVGAFVYHDGEFCYSSPVEEIKATNQNVSLSNYLLFSGNSEITLIPFSMSETWHEKMPTLVKKNGYLDITGAYGKAMVAFSLSDGSVSHEAPISVSFDICCKVKQKLIIGTVQDYGGENIVYEQSVELVGDGKWQKITIDQEYFRRERDGRYLSPSATIETLGFHADEPFIINNIYLV